MTKEQTVLDKERERENRKVSRSIPFFFFFFLAHENNSDPIVP